MPKDPAGPPVNDNQPRSMRRVVNELSPELPVTEPELRLVETHFGAIIAELLLVPANDNEPGSNGGGD